MFSRRDHEIKPVLFPKDWSESLKQILLNIYGQQCLNNDYTFEVYGFSYPSEVLIIISYVGLDKFSLPVTLFLSADLDEKTDSDAIVNTLFDSAGMFFDNYFANEKSEDEVFEDFILDWQDGEFNNTNLFYKVTRENIALTMQADLLLGE